MEKGMIVESSHKTKLFINTVCGLGQRWNITTDTGTEFYHKMAVAMTYAPNDEGNFCGVSKRRDLVSRGNEKNTSMDGILGLGFQVGTAPLLHPLR